MNLLQLHNLIKDYGFIAGGACRATIANEPIKDFDIFCRAKEDYEPLKNLISNMYGLKRENNLVYQCGDIQLIKPRENEHIKTYGTPIEVVSKFDFTVSRVYTEDGKSFKWLDDEFSTDIDKKLLNIKNIVCPISTMKRIVKYSKKGYWASTLTIITLFNHFKGMEVQEDFFNQLNKILIEEQPDSQELYELLEAYGID